MKRTQKKLKTYHAKWKPIWKGYKLYESFTKGQDYEESKDIPVIVEGEGEWEVWIDSTGVFEQWNYSM